MDVLTNRATGVGIHYYYEPGSGSVLWSGRRLEPEPTSWKADALPNELLPLVVLGRRRSVFA